MLRWDAGRPQHGVPPLGSSILKDNQKQTANSNPYLVLINTTLSFTYIFQTFQRNSIICCWKWLSRATQTDGNVWNVLNCACSYVPPGGSSFLNHFHPKEKAAVSRAGLGGSLNECPCPSKWAFQGWQHILYRPLLPINKDLAASDVDSVPGQSQAQLIWGRGISSCV